MFPTTSRYYEIQTAKWKAADGRKIIYLRRRFLPETGNLVVLAEHTVTQGERLDNITARYLGDPEQFWRLCDVNDCLHPGELTAEIGRKVRVSMPKI